MEKDPRAWIVRENDEPSKPTPYDDYPHPDASAVTLYLSSGSPERGRLSTTAAPGQGAETLVDNYPFSGSALAQAEWTNH